MTNETPALPAGRALDAEIAQRVFGHHVEEVLPSYPGQFAIGDADGNFAGFVPNYSTDIRDAWLVVEKLGDIGYTVDIEWKGVDRVYAGTAEVSVTRDIFTRGHGLGTAPEAICRAALAAVHLRDAEARGGGGRKERGDTNG